MIFALIFLVSRKSSFQGMNKSTCFNPVVMCHTHILCSFYLRTATNQVQYLITETQYSVDFTCGFHLWISVVDQYPRPIFYKTDQQKSGKQDRDDSIKQFSTLFHPAYLLTVKGWVCRPNCLCYHPYLVSLLLLICYPYILLHFQCF